MYLRIQILLYNNIWLKQKNFTLKPLQAPHVVQPSFWFVPPVLVAGRPVPICGEANRVPANMPGKKL